MILRRGGQNHFVMPLGGVLQFVENILREVRVGIVDALDAAAQIHVVLRLRGSEQVVDIAAAVEGGSPWGHIHGFVAVVIELTHQIGRILPVDVIVIRIIGDIGAAPEGHRAAGHDLELRIDRRAAVGRHEQVKDHLVPVLRVGVDVRRQAGAEGRLREIVLQIREGFGKQEHHVGPAPDAGILHPGRAFLDGTVGLFGGVFLRFGAAGREGVQIKALIQAVIIVHLRVFRQIL